MIFKNFIFLLPLVFLGCGRGEVQPSVGSSTKVVAKVAKSKTEMVWDGDSKSDISDKEYDEALKKYVELKYPEEVKAYMLKGEIIMLNGLMWQDNEDVKTVERNWIDAKQYCADLNLFGLIDWRLPKITELETIVDRNKKYNINKNFRKIANDLYFSDSTTKMDSSRVYTIDFRHGYRNGEGKYTEHYVRCVRGE